MHEILVPKSYLFTFDNIVPHFLMQFYIYVGSFILSLTLKLINYESLVQHYVLVTFYVELLKGNNRLKADDLLCPKIDCSILLHNPSSGFVCIPQMFNSSFWNQSLRCKLRQSIFLTRVLIC